MGQLGNSIVIMLVMAVIVLVLFSFFRKNLMNKIKINKWVLLVTAVIFLVIPVYILPYGNYSFISYITQGIFIFLFLWYAEITGLFKRKQDKESKAVNIDKHKSDIKYEKDKIVIKPKAKPNRVKNLKK